MLALESPYHAYCLDHAVATWGIALEDAIDKGTEKIKDAKARVARADQIAQRWCGLPVKYREPPGISVGKKA